MLNSCIDETKIKLLLVSITFYQTFMAVIKAATNLLPFGVVCGGVDGFVSSGKEKTRSTF